MFHIICRTLWLDQEVTEEKVSIIKPDRAVSTFKRRIDAEEAKNYLTRVAKRGNLAEDIVNVSFHVMTSIPEVYVENDSEEQND